TEQAFLRAGQIPYERPDDAMWRVEGRHAPIRAQIERVGGEAAAAGGRKHFANVVYGLRVSVGETEEQSLAQTALDARLQRMIVGSAGVVADPNAAVGREKPVPVNNRIEFASAEKPRPARADISDVEYDVARKLTLHAEVPYLRQRIDEVRIKAGNCR